jgi:tRNA A-37 threonylcarbamoyl transferase component Bud32
MSTEITMDAQFVVVQPARVLRPGDSLGPYEIAELIGKGGMGEVFRARDTRLGRNVAIKVLPERLSRDPDALRRFEIEARAASAINHPNILVLYDVGNDDGLPYVVMELLEGESLRSALATGALPVRRALATAHQIAVGLAAAHEKGIVHRDLKPDNVFVTRDGTVKILDFGLAKLTAAPAHGELGVTRTGAVLGTAAYMAPEQIRGEPVDPRSDLFAVGMILHEMLAGARPFAGPTPADVMSAILNEEPAPLPAVPPAIERIVLHLLEKRPAARFQTARDLAFDLESVLAGPSSALQRRPRRRRRVPFAALAVVAAAAAGSAGHAVIARRPPAAVPTFTRLTFRTEKFWRARFTPDGKSVYFAAHAPGDPGLIATFALELGLPEVRRVDVPLDMFLQGLSGTELWVAVDEEQEGGGILSRVPLAGGAPRPVQRSVSEADVTPDGRLVIVRVSAGRFILELPPGHEIYQSPYDLMFPRVSPDGQRVAVIRRRLREEIKGDILVIERDGSTRTLGAGLASVAGLAWSPRGELWVAGATAGDPRALWALSLDGGRRLVAAGPTAMTLFDVDDRGRALVASMQRTRTLYLRGKDGVARNLSWLDGSAPADLARDGSTLLINEDGDAGGAGMRTYLRRADGSEPVLLAPGLGTSLSPDGQWVLVTPPDRSGPIQIVPVGPGAIETLPVATPGERGEPWWLPDGKRIAYTGAGATGAPQIYVQERGATTARAVGPPGLRLWEQAVAPDGKMLLAASPPEFFLVPVAGGPAKRIGPLHNEEHPFALSDDGQVYVHSDHKAERLRIFKLDPERGARADVAEIDNPPVIDALRITPDGSTLAYRINSRTGDLYLVDPGL